MVQDPRDGTPADEVLAARAQHDLDAFAELYRRYKEPVFRFVRARARDDMTAEDLTAQVFVKALAASDSFRKEGTYRAWLFRIARNTISTHFERGNRTASVDEIPDEEDPSPSTATVVIARAELGDVWRMVEVLSPDQREALELRCLRGLTVDEIAGRTDRSPGAVRILLHRARSRLRKLLEGRE